MIKNLKPYITLLITLLSYLTWVTIVLFLYSAIIPYNPEYVLLKTIFIYTAISFAIPFAISLFYQTISHKPNFSKKLMDMLFLPNETWIGPWQIFLGFTITYIIINFITNVVLEKAMTINSFLSFLLSQTTSPVFIGGTIGIAQASLYYLLTQNKSRNV